MSKYLRIIGVFELIAYVIGLVFYFIYLFKIPPINILFFCIYAIFAPVIGVLCLGVSSCLEKFKNIEEKEDKSKPVAIATTKKPIATSINAKK